MKRCFWIGLIAGIVGTAGAWAQTESPAVVDFWSPVAVQTLERTHSLYFGALCLGLNQYADKFDAGSYKSTADSAGKAPAIILFSNEWWRPFGNYFPLATVMQVDQRGAVPFIHLEMTSRNRVRQQRDPVYSLDGIIAGKFDVPLKAWAAAAKKWGKPLLVQWGAEANGATFWWTPKFNGADSTTGYGDPKKFDGAERYRDAYRHIIDLFRAAGATNVKWVFHVESRDYHWLKPAYNNMADLYPGDAYIDVIGTSHYQDAKLPCPPHFEILDSVYAQMARLSPIRPLMICEMGSRLGVSNSCPGAVWYDSLFSRLERGAYPRFVAFCVWGGRWTGKTPGSYNFFEDTAIVSVWKKRVAGNSHYLGKSAR